MSRLYRHKQHQTTKKIVLLLVLIIALSAFMVTMGFQLMVNGVVWVNKTLNPSTETESQQQDDFFGSISLYEPVSATNSAQIEISGQVQEFDAVDIYLNNAKVESIQPRAGSFEERIGILKNGENTIYAVARTKDGKNTKESDTYTVFYKKEPLELSIETPTQDMTTRDQDLQIKGTVDVGSTLRVNNQPIVVSNAGIFDTTIRLKEGENMLLFYAEDVAGNTEEVEIKVRYERED